MAPCPCSPSSAIIRDDAARLRSGPCMVVHQAAYIPVGARASFTAAAHNFVRSTAVFQYHSACTANATTKHMTKRKARVLRGEWQLDWMGGELREEAAGGQHEGSDGAFQAVGGYGVFHQAPD